MDTKSFLKYLKSIDFPNSNYNAIQLYPETEIINGKYINEFNSKYKKKYLYSHEDKNIIINSETSRLFNESLKYISDVQNNLLKKNIENYISGGFAFKLYSLLNHNMHIYNKELFKTKDCDIYVYYDLKRISNKLIVSNLINLVNSIIKFNKLQNYSFVEFYILLNYENTNKFLEYVEILFNEGFDLYTYFIKDNLKNDTKEKIYEFKFLKVINKEFCIRIKIKLLNIEALIIENIYSYTKVTYYYIKKLENNTFKVINKYIPIEFLIKNKNKSNIDLMRNSINVYNRTYHLYNMNSLLYNFLHLFYKYECNTENITIEKKRKECKDIRDEKRLDLFFKIYCKTLYPKLNKNNIKLYLEKLKDSKIKFKKNVEKIKNFKMIEDIFL